MNGMQDYETMERWLGFKGSVDSLDTELAGLHEEEFWNWLICNYKRFVADCKSYDISSTLQMSNSGDTNPRRVVSQIWASDELKKSILNQDV